MESAFQTPLSALTNRHSIAAIGQHRSQCHSLSRFPRTKINDSSRLRYSPVASTPLDSHSRRNFLMGVAATFLLTPVKESKAYSSPYRPGEAPAPLPDRLFERSSSDIVKTPTGLQYFDLAAGSGTEAAQGDTVIVNYTSRLRGLNGIKVASSFDDPSSPPFIFRIGAPDVVPGVSEAVTGMKIGGKRRAVLPPSIAYASPDMKPSVTEFFARRRLLSVLETNRDATIVFDLELLKIK